MRTICASMLTAGLLIATNADAAPLLSHMQPTPDSLIKAAKVICDEAGNCYRPTSTTARRPLGLWRQEFLWTVCRTGQLRQSAVSLQLVALVLI